MMRFMTPNRIATIVLLFTGLSALTFAEDRLPLSITTTEHPHTRAISNGTIEIPECRISYSTASLSDILKRFDEGASGDILEVDIIESLKRMSKTEPEKRNWVLVPVYLWREFPHRYVAQQKPFPNETFALWAKGVVSTSTKITDYKMAEQEYFKATRIFPIITVLAVRKELADANPWLPEAIFIAFSEAKAKALEDGTLPLPWGPQHRDETIELMNKNYWSYGVRNNPKTLGALFKYAHEQGITDKEWSAEDVFAPETITLIDEKGAKN